MVKAVEFGVKERDKRQGGFYLIITRDKRILSHSCLLVIRVVSLRDNALNTILIVPRRKIPNKIDEMGERPQDERREIEPHGRDLSGEFRQKLPRAISRRLMTLATSSQKCKVRKPIRVCAKRSGTPAN